MPDFRSLLKCQVIDHICLRARPPQSGCQNVWPEIKYVYCRFLSSFFLRKKWSKLGCVLYTGAHAMRKKLCFSQRLCLIICPHKLFKSETVIYYGDFKILEALLLLVYEKNYGKFY